MDVDCECAVEQGGFPSVEACISFATAITEAGLSCEEPIFLEHAGETQPILECQIDALYASPEL